MTIEPFGLQPEAALAWFRAKGMRVSFDWRDVWREEHAQAFTVAKAMSQDILNDIRSAVDEAIAEGTTLAQFQKQLRPILQAKGWWGEQEMTDPETGETKLVQLGSARRLAIIYDTNLRTSHAAGKWQRIEETKRSRPWLRYIARPNGPNRRQEHQVFADKVFAVDDPIWSVIFPPNGWGCACAVQQLSEAEVGRLGLAPSPPLELEYERYVNRRTGEVTRVPRGIDPGFDYNPGQTRRSVEPKPLPPPKAATPKAPRKPRAKPKAAATATRKTTGFARVADEETFAQDVLDSLQSNGKGLRELIRNKMGEVGIDFVRPNVGTYSQATGPGHAWAHVSDVDPKYGRVGMLNSFKVLFDTSMAEAARGHARLGHSLQLKTMVHEEVHMAKKARGYYGSDIWIEEVTTELAAQRICHEAFGFAKPETVEVNGRKWLTLPTGYQDAILETIADVARVTGMTEQESLERITDAALEMCLPGDNQRSYLQAFFQGLRVTDEHKKELRAILSKKGKP